MVGSYLLINWPLRLCQRTSHRNFTWKWVGMYNIKMFLYQILLFCWFYKATIAPVPLQIYITCLSHRNTSGFLAAPLLWLCPQTSYVCNKMNELHPSHFHIKSCTVKRSQTHPWWCMEPKGIKHMKALSPVFSASCCPADLCPTTYFHIRAA